MDIYSQLAEKNIKAQETIVGPLALEQAKKVNGLQLTDSQIVISGDKKAILDNLVHQYEGLFGRASVQVCRDAAKGMLDQLPKDQIPPSLV